MIQWRGGPEFLWILAGSEWEPEVAKRGKRQWIWRYLGAGYPADLEKPGPWGLGLFH